MNARMAFERYKLHMVPSMLSVLLHLVFLLLCAGLIVLLFSVNHTVASVVTVALGIGTLIYSYFRASLSHFEAVLQSGASPFTSEAEDVDEPGIGIPCELQSGKRNLTPI